MREDPSIVERHYARGHTLDTILMALRGQGKDPSRLSPMDLAPVDEFHIRGRDATVELAARLRLTPGLQVLDIGCGLGGSARYLATEHGCAVTGVDLTEEYVDAARSLADRVGVHERVDFRTASALALPFPDGAFDVVWTEHAQMNIEDKRAFYAEAARVLAPGGRLVFHDFFKGDGGPVQFPVPWADAAAISFLVAPDDARAILRGLGLRIVDWVDQTEAACAWLEDRLRQPPSPLGIHLLMGPTARLKLENVVRNLRDGRVAVIQAVAEKPRPG